MYQWLSFLQQMTEMCAALKFDGIYLGQSVASIASGTHITVPVLLEAIFTW